MWQALKKFDKAHRQTKFFVFTFLIYMIAMVWTTIQAYGRLVYSRSDAPVTIEIPPAEHK